MFGLDGTALSVELYSPPSYNEDTFPPPLMVFELVLENFVYPWFRDITDDESSVDELRATLRFFASVLIRRIYKVDIPAVITKKMLKAAMKHIEVIAKARQKVKNAEYLQQAALEEYGPELHVAVRSRRDELLYLKKLTELLFAYILPPKATDCRSFTLLIREILSGSVFLPSMDFLADPISDGEPMAHVPQRARRALSVGTRAKSPQHCPSSQASDNSVHRGHVHAQKGVVVPGDDIASFHMAGQCTAKDLFGVADTVNHLLLIFIDDSPPEKATEPASALVPFLQKFAEPRNKKSSVLQLDLKEIKAEQDLFFLFMNFLKKEGAVHVLQFYLDVEQFNDRILQPELSDSEMMSLHEEVQKIYRTYCLDESVDKIRFDPFIVEEIKSIADGPYIEVVKLQTMRCLFEAYEHVFSLLDNVFTPRFCHSSEYFRYLLRQDESPTRNSKSNKSTQKKGESSGIRSISSKIKGVFKSTTLEGAVLPSCGLAEGEDIEEGIMVMEDDSPVEALSMPNTPRNLAAWKITIPYVDFFEDPSLERKERRERIPVFCIDVERNDRMAVGHSPEHWSVYRKYLEFYVLESKLTEFHGTFPDAQLPSKRIIGPKNYEFLKSKREEFQEYLQKLSQHPELSNSQLLADFLSPNGGETQFLDKMLPDVNLGKIIKSVPGKLMKEKGQHLEPFIINFINSCESPKPKPSKPELTILSPTSENNKKFHSTKVKPKPQHQSLEEPSTVVKLFNELYKNNANRSENLERRQNQNYFMEMMTVEGVYDYLMYIGEKLHLDFLA
ncbi:Sorting nexin-14 [Varanus komodoensis]|nr:Sorting nexin-14 [Varanus komodoensis]